MPRPTRSWRPSPSAIGPRGIGVSPDGRTICVALGHDNVIAVVDATSRAVKARCAAGTDPEAFAVSPDGARLYRLRTRTPTPPRSSIRRRARCWRRSPSARSPGVAVSPDGRLVCHAAETTHTISAIDTSALQDGGHDPRRQSPARESAFTPGRSTGVRHRRDRRRRLGDRRGEECRRRHPQAGPPCPQASRWWSST